VKYSLARKEELVALFADVVEKTGLEISERERVDGRAPAADGVFEVVTPEAHDSDRRGCSSHSGDAEPAPHRLPGRGAREGRLQPRRSRALPAAAPVVVGGGDAALEGAVASPSSPGTASR
jgi:hypothetical protein